MAVAGHKGQVRAPGTSTAMSAEACTVVTGTSNQTWKITAATKNMFDHAVTFTVEADEGGGFVTLSPAEFSINYLLGSVDLDAYTSGTGVVANVIAVRVSGSYFPKYDVLGGRSVSGSVTPAELMSAVFTNEGEARIYGRDDTSFELESIERQWTPLDGDGGTEDSLYDRVLAGTPFIFEVRPNDANEQYFRSWVKIMNNAEDFSGGSLHTTSLTLAGAQQSAAMSSQSVRLWDVQF